jgi:hypothetical protein
MPSAGQPRAAAPHRPAFALLEHPHQLDLKGLRGLADLVEKPGPAVGLLEESDTIRIGPGEGPALATEQLGLQ